MSELERHPKAVHLTLHDEVLALHMAAAAIAGRAKVSMLREFCGGDGDDLGDGLIFSLDRHLPASSLAVQGRGWEAQTIHPAVRIVGLRLPEAPVPPGFYGKTLYPCSRRIE